MSAVNPIQSARVFFVCLAAINGGILAWVWFSPSDITYENGPIENLQIVVLTLSFLTYAQIFFTREKAAQTLAGSLCLLCAFLILKELDFRELIDPALSGGSYWNEKTPLEGGRKIMRLFFLLLVLILLIGRFRDAPSIIRAGVSWRAWPFILSVSLLVLGQAFEHDGFRNPQGLTGLERINAVKAFHRALEFSRIWEELSELNAHLVLLYAAQSRAVISNLVAARGRK